MPNWKPKCDGYIRLEARKAIHRDASAAALWVEIPLELAEQRWSRDPDDDVFIRTVLAAQPPRRVTGDDDLLSITVIEALKVLTPAQALVAWTAT